MRFCLFVSALIVVAAIAATGCGSGDDKAASTTATAQASVTGTPSSTAAAGTTTATPAAATTAGGPLAGLCANLTLGNVGQAIGETVTLGPTGGVECSFKGSGFDQVNVTLSGLGTDPVAGKASFERAKQNNATDISGFGEAAYWYLGNDKNSLLLSFLKNNYAVGINVYTTRGTEANLDSAKKIATLLLPNVPQ